MFYFVFDFGLSRDYSYYSWNNWVCFDQRIYFFIPRSIGKGMNQQIHLAKNKNKRYLLFLCELGQFVNIFGGGRPKVYILGYI